MMRARTTTRQRAAGAGGHGLRGGPMGDGHAGPEGRRTSSGTLFRLLGYFRPQTLSACSSSSWLAILSTVFSIVGPKILGHGDDQALRRASSPSCGGMPRRGDRLRLHRAHPADPARCSTSSAPSSATSSSTSWPASRRRPSTTCAATWTRSSPRLPLKFFDSRTHGEILSRVINDMDNISTHAAAEPDAADHLHRHASSASS